MSDTFTVNPPYIDAAVPGEDDEDDVFPLEPNHVYKIGLDRRDDLTLFYKPSKGNNPTLAEASQLDQDPNAAEYGWFDGTVCTLVTEGGKEILELGSLFFTNADNKVTRSSPEVQSRYLGPQPSSCSGPGASLVREVMVKRGMMKAGEGKSKLQLPL